MKKPNYEYVATIGIENLFYYSEDLGGAIAITNMINEHLKFHDWPKPDASADELREAFGKVYALNSQAAASIRGLCSHLAHISMAMHRDADELLADIDTEESEAQDDTDSN